MAQKVTNAKTKLSAEDVTVRAVQFFTNEKWTAQTQTARAVTFRANMPAPKMITGILLMLGGFAISCTIIGMIVGIPMIIAGSSTLFFAKKQMRGSRDLVVTATPSGNGTEVVITHGRQAVRSVNQFVGSLPQ